MPSQGPLKKVAKLIHAWETHFPEVSFAGLTLAEFKSGVQPSYDVRTEIAENAARTVGLKAKRDVLDASSNALAERVVAGVKGDPAHGADGVMWAAMGYVRKSDRSHGLVRRSRANGVQGAAQAANETQGVKGGRGES